MLLYTVRGDDGAFLVYFRIGSDKVSRNCGRHRRMFRSFSVHVLMGKPEETKAGNRAEADRMSVSLSE